MAWVPGAQRLPVWIIDDRITAAMARDLVQFGQRDPRRSPQLAYRQSDVPTLQAIMRPRIPRRGRDPLPRNAGLIDLGR